MKATVNIKPEDTSFNPQRFKKGDWGHQSYTLFLVVKDWHKNEEGILTVEVYIPDSSWGNGFETWVEDDSLTYTKLSPKELTLS